MIRDRGHFGIFCTYIHTYITTWHDYNELLTIYAVNDSRSVPVRDIVQTPSVNCKIISSLGNLARQYQRHPRLSRPFLNRLPAKSRSTAIWPALLPSCSLRDTRRIGLCSDYMRLNETLYHSQYTLVNNVSMVERNVRIRRNGMKHGHMSVFESN